MENKIKVTVEYEKPEMSKIDALIEQYAIAEKIADETVAEVTPVINECGLEKYNAICEQLKTVGNKLRKFCLRGKRKVSPYIEAWYSKGNDSRRFVIKYEYERDRLLYLFHKGTWNDGDDFMNLSSNYEGLMGRGGLVTHWNSKNIIKDLNMALERKINGEIKDQAERIENVKSHLNNMLK